MTHQLSILSRSGQSLSIHAAGSGPVVMLVHGFPLDHRMWTHQFESFSEKYQVVAPELRGFGQSSLSDPDYALSDLADDLEQVRLHFTRDQEIVLIGLSMGGYVAFEYLKRYSEHVSGIVLTNTKPDADPPAAAQQRREMAQIALEYGSWRAASGMPANLLCEQTQATQPETLEIVEQMIRSTSPAAIAAAQYAMAKRVDQTEFLSSITTPSLVITGEYDSLCTPSATSQWASRIHNANCEIIADAGHLSPLECPHAWNEVVVRFIDSIK